jgi:SAM-dependent methyltransferase
MRPEDIGRSYDTIASKWQEPQLQSNGIAAFERALQFTQARRCALDIGCECSGRFIDRLLAAGFQVEGVDVSAQMIGLARARNPGVTLYRADIGRWAWPRAYDFILGWDSVWHVPLAEQRAVLEQMCAGLAPGGVLLFTLGGTDEPGEKRDACMGPPMYTATLGIPQTLAVLAGGGCVCRHLEYDQYPQLHVYVIAQKR